MDTFANGAMRGDFYYLHCHACGRKGVRVTAQEMASRGWGAVEVVGVQARLKCQCGARGKTSISRHVGGGPAPELGGAQGRR